MEVKLGVYEKVISIDDAEFEEEAVCMQIERGGSLNA